MNNNTASSGGVSFLGLLALVFIVLKLAGIGAVAGWTWLWVLSPLWIPLAIFLGFCGIAIVLGLVGGLVALLAAGVSSSKFGK